MIASTVQQPEPPVVPAVVPAVVPMRSAIFVPAANARALEKSAGLRADALVFDLEDSAMPEAKDAAREALRACLALRRKLEGGQKLEGGPRIVVRINALASKWGTEDLLMARGAGVDAILLPKVGSAEDVQVVAQALAETDAPAGLALWAMIETARGLLDVARIAEAGAATRLAALVVGPNDIAVSTGVRISAGRAEIVGWLGQVVLAAKAFGLKALDGVFNDIADPQGLLAEAEQGARLGFDGKALIHPNQIEAADRAFAPSPQALAGARAIIAAFADPANRERGVLRLEGRMVERLHLLEAERLVAYQEAIQRGRRETMP